MPEAGFESTKPPNEKHICDPSGEKSAFDSPLLGVFVRLVWLEPSKSIVKISSGAFGESLLVNTNFVPSADQVGKKLRDPVTFGSVEMYLRLEPSALMTGMPTSPLSSLKVNFVPSGDHIGRDSQLALLVSRLRFEPSGSMV